MKNRYQDRPSGFVGEIARAASPAAREVIRDMTEDLRGLCASLRRPPFPDLPPVSAPVAVIDPDTADAALASMAAIDEQSAALRRFLRDGSEYRRATGRALPTREWDAAHDRIHDLARQRQRIQSALGRYRRDRRDRERLSFERAFVEIARRELDIDRFAELSAEAQRSSGSAL